VLVGFVFMTFGLSMVVIAKDLATTGRHRLEWQLDEARS
jgi:hypothetical protein